MVLSCQSSRNVSRIQRKVGNGSVLMGTESLDTRFLGFIAVSYCLPLPTFVRDRVRSLKISDYYNTKAMAMSIKSLIKKC